MKERKMMNLLKKQEKRALEWLYEEYSPIIYGTARQIGKTDEVIEKILVKTYTNAWSEAKTIDIVKDRALPWVLNILLDTLVEFTEAGDPAQLSSLRALKSDLDSNKEKYQENLSRLERAIEEHLNLQEVQVEQAMPDDTKLQQSIMALRVRMRVNQILMPR